MEKSVMKKSRKHYELDYKRQIVSEYMSGKISAEDLAQREGLERAVRSTSGVYNSISVNVKSASRRSLRPKGFPSTRPDAFVSWRRNWRLHSRSWRRRCWKMTF